MSRWANLVDLYRIVRCRMASKKDRLDDAIRFLDGGARPGSTYHSIIPLYRLTLMVCAKDPRRTVEAARLLEQDWSKSDEEELWLEAYRRYLCFGVLGDFDRSNAAKAELRGKPVRGFIQSTIGVPQ